MSYAADAKAPAKGAGEAKSKKGGKDSDEDEENGDGVGETKVAGRGTPELSHHLASLQKYNFWILWIGMKWLILTIVIKIHGNTTDSEQFTNFNIRNILFYIKLNHPILHQTLPSAASIDATILICIICN